MDDTAKERDVDAYIAVELPTKNKGVHVQILGSWDSTVLGAYSLDPEFWLIVDKYGTLLQYIFLLKYCRLRVSPE
ncbi:hypothetical protein NECAME_10547 [Necator americanus]|uniref:Uncharacterized protein n=1 Tax=Necator americanus TaxID=51031 RepID=W2T8D6_NECAM|nr:hypothetical protein NECAME_10547 [Necator americanus]ETN78148.1 hypothetical protein NECAME_10547 [Necator americanus]